MPFHSFACPICFRSTNSSVFPALFSHLLGNSSAFSLTSYLDKLSSTNPIIFIYNQKGKNSPQPFPGQYTITGFGLTLLVFASFFSFFSLLPHIHKTNLTHLIIYKMQERTLLSLRIYLFFFSFPFFLIFSPSALLSEFIYCCHYHHSFCHCFYVTSMSRNAIMYSENQ